VSSQWRGKKKALVARKEFDLLEINLTGGLVQLNSWLTCKYVHESTSLASFDFIYIYLFGKIKTLS